MAEALKQIKVNQELINSVFLKVGGDYRFSMTMQDAVYVASRIFRMAPELCLEKQYAVELAIAVLRMIVYETVTIDRRKETFALIDYAIPLALHATPIVDIPPRSPAKIGLCGCGKKQTASP